MTGQRTATGPTDHLPAVFLDWLDHLARCQRCRVRAMTADMVAELLAGAYREPE